jgi:hypothetical protein
MFIMRFLSSKFHKYTKDFLIYKISVQAISYPLHSSFHFPKTLVVGKFINLYLLINLNWHTYIEKEKVRILITTLEFQLDTKT